jgi:hypothetical protein
MAFPTATDITLAAFTGITGSASGSATSSRSRGRISGRDVGWFGVDARSAVLAWVSICPEPALRRGIAYWLSTGEGNCLDAVTGDASLSGAE